MKWTKTTNNLKVSQCETDVPDRLAQEMTLQEVDEAERGQ